jgi:ferrous iron transport protein B
LIAGAFFDNSGWISALMYFLGIVLIFLGALLVNLITGHKAKKSYFIIELPEYKAPSFLGAFKSMCSRGWAYIVKAATIILLCNTLVHLMQSFTWGFTPANETASDSILASIAGPLSYLFVPVIGVISWQLTAAIVTGFVAKENVVGTLAVCFLGASSATALGDALPLTAVSALAYLMFNLFSPPCFAAIGAMNAEMKSTKWIFAGIGLQLAVGYTVAYLTYTLGTLFSAPATLNVGAAIAGLVFVLAVVAFVVYLILRNRNSMKKSVLR